MRRAFLILPLLLLLFQDPVCMDVPGGRVCYEQIATETPSPTPTETIIPTATVTLTPTLTPTPLASEYIFDLYRNPGAPLVGTVSGGDWAFPGTALSANTFLFWGNYLHGRQIVYARWVVVWNPSAGASPTGIRLVKTDDGPSNIIEIARIDRTNYNGPIVDMVDISAALQALLDAGVGKHIGEQTYGNGGNGLLLYSSSLEIVIR